MPNSNEPNRDYLKYFQFERFSPEKEEWEYYIQRFQMELQIHGLDTNADDNPAKRRNLLLSKVGPEPFKILVDHFKPDNVNSKSFDDILGVLNNYYGKKTYILSERVAFALRFRKDGETITQFVSALRGLAGNCEFGASLNERLRDQLVIGVNNSPWQQELIRAHPANTATLEQVQASAIVLEQAMVQSKRLASFSLGQTGRHANQLKSKFKKTPNQKTKSARTLNAETDCLLCGHSRHKDREQCPAKGKKCSACGSLNHFARVCISTGNAQVSDKTEKRDKQKTRQVGEKGNKDHHSSEDDESYSSTNTTNIRNIQSTNKVMLNTNINNIKAEMLYDPGAAHSVAGKKFWKRIGRPTLTKTNNLVAYTDVEIETLGIAEVNVKAFNSERKLPLYITKTDDIPLFGLDWCIAFGLSFPPGARLCQVTLQNESNKETGNRQTTQVHKKTPPNENHQPLEIDLLLDEFSELFSGHIGAIKGHTAKIHMKPESTPKAFRPRPVPIALQDQVTAELQRLVKEDVIEPVDTTSTPIEWATPIVLAIKSNGSIRICGDFSVTINPHVKKNDYPLPRFEDITAKLSGGKYFSKIDLKDAYLQLPVHPDSTRYLVISTHRGYYTYKRLPFGVNFAPSLFQQTMDQILSGLDGVVCYLDDILITASNKEQHLERVRLVLERLRSVGIRTQKSKCKWFQGSVTFLGHTIDSEGLHPTTEHLTAIRDMPSPTNVTDLRSFLGSITYYGKFIQNLHVLCVPLHRHLKKGAVFQWTPDDEQLFIQLKNVLTSSDTLVHYDSNLPLVVTSDASNKGAGAVLFHEFPNGNLRPIAFASRSFTDTELRYSTIDKEALAIVFAVTRFHQYLYGRHFTLLTDHKPLERILSENRETPKIASSRLLRWAMILNSYDYGIAYHPGKENAPADALSRLPLADTDLSSVEIAGLPKRSHLLHLRIHHLPITKRILQAKTSGDKNLLKIIKCIQTYWPKKTDIPTELWPFYEKREELSFEENILLWKGRICIPEVLRLDILKMLHDGHPGISAMQSMARLHVYWPEIDADIINHVKTCVSCQESKQSDNKFPLYPWSPPPEPWSRVHIDFAGPFEGKMWLIIIDAYTRWLEIIPMKNITSNSTTTALREVFSRLGYPKFIVSDNGPQLTSDDFEVFCKSYGITHIRTTPYHPKTNGLAERAVKTFKERMSASDTGDDQDYRLQTFLFAYRNTIQRSTGRAPSELLFGRPLRSKFDQLKPDLFRNMDREQANQKRIHDRGARAGFFETDQPVWVNNPLGKGSFPGNIIEQTGPYSYVVEVNGTLKRKHGDQMRPRHVEPSEALPELEVENPLPDPHDTKLDNTDVSPEIDLGSSITGAPSSQVEGNAITVADGSFSSTPVPEVRRNPVRDRKLPLRFRI